MYCISCTIINILKFNCAFIQIYPHPYTSIFVLNGDMVCVFVYFEFYKRLVT